MKASADSYVPLAELSAHLNIKNGDVLYVASDLVRLARITIKNEGSFNADMLMDSLIKKIGQEGTLILPAFNFKLKNGDRFDIRNTIPETGALSIAAFKRNDFKRTSNPLHSFLVFGKGTNELMNLKNESSFSDDSPYGFLYRHNAKMLSIDLDLQGGLTFAHYVEEKEKVFYRRNSKYKIKYTDAHGHQSIKEYRIFKKYPGFINDLNQMEREFSDSSVSENTNINGVRFSIVNLVPAYEILKKNILEKNASGLYRFSVITCLKDMFKSITGIR